MKKWPLPQSKTFLYPLYLYTSILGSAPFHPHDHVVVIFHHMLRLLGQDYLQMNRPTTETRSKLGIINPFQHITHSKVNTIIKL